VGSWGHLGLVPQPLQSLGGLLGGASVRELLLRDGGGRGRALPLLARMASDTPAASGISLPFLSALRAFKSRHCLANAVNDFLVPYETAALNVEALEVPLRAAAAGPPRVLYTRTRPAAAAAAGAAAALGRAAERGDLRALQGAMAASLGSLGWTETAVAFPSLLPLAHNRIVALRRDPILTAMNACGMEVVRHTAGILIAELREHAWEGEGAAEAAAAAM